MRVTTQKLKRYSVFVMLLGFMTGCGLPGPDREKAESLSGLIEQANSMVAERASAFERLQSSSEYDFFRRYAEREHWDSSLVEAQRALSHAQRVLNTEVDSLLRRNKKNDAPQLTTQVARVESSLRDARKSASEIGNRIAFLEVARDSAPQWVRIAEANVLEINNLFGSLRTLTAQAKREHGNAESIDSRFAPFVSLHRETNGALARVQSELRAFSAGADADVAVIGDSTKFVSERLANIKERNESYRATIGELYRDYSKTLVDMRVDYFVQVGRTSWDNWSDFNTDKNHEYQPRRVDESVYEYFDDLAETTVLARGKTANRVTIDQAKWNVLSIVSGEAWPRGHDDAEWWLNNAYEKYFHKYVIVEDGEEGETEWQQVTADVFDEHWDDLGMTIAAKPYGVFEDDVLDDAAPPGLAYVGNAQYGQWRERDGGSFWEFYGKYMFLSSLMGYNRPYYYSRGEWNTWRNDYRGRGAYYGSSSGGYTRYGTYGRQTATGTNSRYASSRFARQGGFNEARAEARAGRGPTSRTQTSSVRGAGAAARGGGPGTRGK